MGLFMIFPEMTVLNLKEFTVTFNQELEYGKDYSKDIFITRQVDGEASVTSFTAKVDSANSVKLLISPTPKWEKWETLLMITSGLQNKNEKTLGKDAMKFEVGDDFRVQDISK